MIPNKKTPIFFLCVSSVFLLFPSTVRSQQNASSPPSDLTKCPVKLTLKAQGFTDAIATLSTKLALNILADDEPASEPVTLNIDGSVKDALDQVSEAFDYRWKQNPSGVIVMYKRFHNVAEHPQYILPELRRMAHDVAAIFKAIPNALPVDPNDDFTARTNTFFGLLTPPQVITLQAGKMLHGSDLNGEQAEALQNAILRNMFSGQITPWQELVVELDGLDRSFFQVKASPEVNFKPQRPTADAVAKSPTSLKLFFGLKASDGSVFSRFIASKYAVPSAAETKKP